MEKQFPQFQSLVTSEGSASGPQPGGLRRRAEQSPWEPRTPGRGRGQVALTTLLPRAQSLSMAKADNQLELRTLLSGPTMDPASTVRDVSETSQTRSLPHSAPTPHCARGAHLHIGGPESDHIKEPNFIQLSNPQTTTITKPLFFFCGRIGINV